MVFEGYEYKTKTCKVCGKEFFGLYDWDNYAYKRKEPLRYYCSWNCFRKQQSKPKKMYIKHIKNI